MLPSTPPGRFPHASRVPPWLTALGPGRLVVGGDSVTLPAGVLRVLLRLAVAAGKTVPVERIVRDVWNLPGAPVGRVERTRVQKCVARLRAAAGGDAASFIRTEGGIAASGYRLMLPPERIDFLRFTELVELARGADAVTAAAHLESALALWTGTTPLCEVAGLPFAAPTTSRLLAMRATAERDLVGLYRDTGRLEQALTFGTARLRDRPGDAELEASLVDIERRARPHRGELIRRVVGLAPPVTLLVLSGDLFAHDDAHLVVGFTDTFDTDTRGSVVISTESLQAQAVQRLFGGDRRQLDRRLRAALGSMPVAGREERAAKPLGRLIRYPIGTVAVLRTDDRRVFSLAYSRMGNDLLARSSVEELRTSLERLWDAVHREGGRRPVAMPLIGTGLARVDGASPTALLRLIIESFVDRSRQQPVTRELRVVLRAPDIAHIDLDEVAAGLDKL
jgi:hypothetical protein